MNKNPLGRCAYAVLLLTVATISSGCAMFTGYGSIAPSVQSLYSISIVHADEAGIVATSFSESAALAGDRAAKLETLAGNARGLADAIEDGVALSPEHAALLLSLAEEIGVLSVETSKRAAEDSDQLPRVNALARRAGSLRDMAAEFDRLVKGGK